MCIQNLDCTFIVYGFLAEIKYLNLNNNNNNNNIQYHSGKHIYYTQLFSTAAVQKDEEINDEMTKKTFRDWDLAKKEYGKPKKIDYTIRVKEEIHEIQAWIRNKDGTRDSNKLRAQGYIPVLLFGKGSDGDQSKHNLYISSQHER